MEEGEGEGGRGEEGEGEGQEGERQISGERKMVSHTRTGNCLTGL